MLDPIRSDAQVQHTWPNALSIHLMHLAKQILLLCLNVNKMHKSSILRGKEDELKKLRMNFFDRLNAFTNHQAGALIQELNATHRDQFGFSWTVL